MKTLYESILDDEDVLVNNVKVATNNWLCVLCTTLKQERNISMRKLKTLLFNKESYNDIFHYFKDYKYLTVKIDNSDKYPEISLSLKKDDEKKPIIYITYIEKDDSYHLILKKQEYIFETPIRKYCDWKLEHCWNNIPDSLSKRYSLDKPIDTYFYNRIKII